MLFLSLDSFIVIIFPEQGPHTCTILIILDYTFLSEKERNHCELRLTRDPEDTKAAANKYENTWVPGQDDVISS